MKNVLYKAASWLAVAGGMLALLIAVVTIVNVTAFGLDKIARLFDANVPAIIGYEDFVMIVSSAALMFFPYCQVKRGHVAVDVFIKMFPAWFSRWVDVISGICMTARGSKRQHPFRNPRLANLAVLCSGHHFDVPLGCNCRKSDFRKRGRCLNVN